MLKIFLRPVAFVLAAFTLSGAMAQITPMKEIPEYWNFLLDQREWELGLQGLFRGQQTRKYVLKGQDTDDWKEIVITSRIERLPGESLKQFLHLTREGAAENCPDTKFNVIEEAPDNLLYERIQTRTCDGAAPQTELRRLVVNSKGMALSIAYLAKTASLGTIQRNQWIELLRFATPK